MNATAKKTTFPTGPNYSQEFRVPTNVNRDKSDGTCLPKKKRGRKLKEANEYYMKSELLIAKWKE